MPSTVEELEDLIVTRSYFNIISYDQIDTIYNIGDREKKDINEIKPGHHYMIAKSTQFADAKADEMEKQMIQLYLKFRMYDITTKPVNVAKMTFTRRQQHHRRSLRQRLGSPMLAF
mmetsp:Transcript_8828/g.9795  ORF Transcript_8828/g.9795 Transcript_8828/m.9795 type:complete len:116 (-) Transcript_8828:292-639(-)